jgi:2'-5' RNA ligase
MVIRSFLAFELPADIKRIVLKVYDEMRRFPLDIRWVKVDNIHLTLIFMGNIRADHVQGIGEAAEKVCQRFGPFNVFLKNAGIFGSKRSPRVFWLGLDGDIARMAHFRDSLHKHLKAFGIKEEDRRFSPHLTLGRFRKGTRLQAGLDELLSRFQDLMSPTCAFTELILFKSDLKPGGAVYTRLNAWPLVGER